MGARGWPDFALRPALVNGAAGLAFFQVELQDGIENPLAAMPVVKEFAEKVAGWVAEPPVREELTAIGSYRSF